jgi:hypothetical protein
MVLDTYGDKKMRRRRSYSLIASQELALYNSWVKIGKWIKTWKVKRTLFNRINGKEPTIFLYFLHFQSIFKLDFELHVL